MLQRSIARETQKLSQRNVSRKSIVSTGIMSSIFFTKKLLRVFRVSRARLIFNLAGEKFFFPTTWTYFRLSVNRVYPADPDSSYRFMMFPVQSKLDYSILDKAIKFSRWPST